MSATIAVDHEGLVGYPEALRERYRAAGIWAGRSLDEELRAARYGSAPLPALVTAAGRWSYGQLDTLCERFARGLLARTALRPGDAVMFSMGNTAETVVAYYGALRAGLVPVCTLPQHGAREIGVLAGHTGARGHFVQADFRGQDLLAMAAAVTETEGTARELVVFRGTAPPGAHEYLDLLEAGDTAPSPPAAPDLDAPVVYQLSGGTTGLPKIAPRLHEEYAYNARQWAARLGWSPRTTVLYPLPIMHNAGIALALQPAHLSGARVVLTGKADVDSILDAIEAERPNVLPLVPPAVAIRLLEHPRTPTVDLSCIEEFIVGGQKLPLEVADRLENELGLPLRQMFGMAEGMFFLTPSDAAPEVRQRTVGEPISEDDEVRVYGIGTETEVPDGVEGELCARGPYTIRGYYRAGEHNREAFTADGFYRTGDLAARRRIEGGVYYSIEGRIKDVINRGVEKIHAEEVEDLIVRHPAVADAAVVAMPDRELGERACAYLVLAEGAEPLDVAALAEHLRSCGLAKYKLPERVELLEAFPLTNVGKVAKKTLRADIAAKLDT
ncbi:AMP-binding protein [Sciscionella sediminilitoris]|uniref:AMP-binding protein n=1 Tax=Sciscionella sediminilitoris TaxID=1445613 RepID=UPI0004DF8A9D|nr:AMP-binding protein [Sciscionella sp. SE31]